MQRICMRSHMSHIKIRTRFMVCFEGVNEITTVIVERTREAKAVYWTNIDVHA